MCQGEAANKREEAEMKEPQDELIRDDVLSWKRKRKRESRKKAPVSSTQDMFVEKE